MQNLEELAHWENVGGKETQHAIIGLSKFLECRYLGFLWLLFRFGMSVTHDRLA